MGYQLNGESEIIREWIRVLMLPPEGVTGEDAEKREVFTRYIPPGQRQILRLHFGYDQSLRDIARVLGTSERVVEARLDAARKKVDWLDNGYRSGALGAIKTTSKRPRCRNCLYHGGGKNSTGVADGITCEYILITGISRVKNGVKLENGKCAWWKHGSRQERDALAAAKRDQWRNDGAGVWPDLAFDGSRKENDDK